MKKIVRKFLIKFFPRLCYRRPSFSQDGEDLIMRAFYEGQTEYRGFYVDVGAHHPFRFSNTAVFYNKGWSGINIEPTPSLIHNFRTHRKRDINLNIAISDVKSTLIFYLFDEPALNSFNAELSEHRHKTTPFKIVDKIKIETFPLSEVLDKYLPHNQKIDFLTIDAEGLDFEILKSNNWNKYKPEFILVEHNFDPDNLPKDEAYIFLKELNYRLVARTMRTSVYRLTNA